MSCSCGGATAGCASTFTTSPVLRRRPASVHAFPLIVTYRDWMRRRICDQERSVSQCRSAADSVWFWASDAAWNVCDESPDSALDFDLARPTLMAHKCEDIPVRITNVCERSAPGLNLRCAAKLDTSTFQLLIGLPNILHAK